MFLVRLGPREILVGDLENGSEVAAILEHTDLVSYLLARKGVGVRQWRGL